MSCSLCYKNILNLCYTLHILCLLAIYFVTYQQPRYHILYTVTIKNVLPLRQRCKKKQNVTFTSKSNFLPKCLQNSDFRPCVMYEYLSFIKKNLFSCFFFLNISIWCRINLMTVSINIFSCLWSTKPCPRFLLICFAR